MVKDEMDDGEHRKKHKGESFWTTDRILLLFFFIVGLIIGGYVMHQFIEPILSADYPKCKSDLKTLNDEIKSCYEKLSIQEKQAGVQGIEPPVQ